MELALPDEMTEYIQQEVECGDFDSPEDVVQEGLKLLREQREQWRAVLREKIEEGIRSLDEGRFVTPEELEASMAEMKATWMAERGLT